MAPDEGFGLVFYIMFLLRKTDASPRKIGGQLILRYIHVSQVMSCCFVLQIEGKLEPIKDQKLVADLGKEACPLCSLGLEVQYTVSQPLLNKPCCSNTLLLSVTTKIVNHNECVNVNRVRL